MSNLLFDIEADGLEPTQIFCVVIMDVDTQDVFTFDDKQLDEAYKMLANADKLIGHNILGYDIPAIEEIAGVRLSHIKAVDTLVLSRLFKPTREGGHGLENWGYRLGFNKGLYGKSEGAWTAFSDAMLEYCKRDVLLNFKVYNALRRESRGFSPTSVRIEHETAKILNQQRKNGFVLDQQKATMLVAMFQEKLLQVEEEVKENE